MLELELEVADGFQKVEVQVLTLLELEVSDEFSEGVRVDPRLELEVSDGFSKGTLCPPPNLNKRSVLFPAKYRTHTGS